MSCFSQRTPALTVRLLRICQRSWMKAAITSFWGVAMTGAMDGFWIVESRLAKNVCVVDRPLQRVVFQGIEDLDDLPAARVPDDVRVDALESEAGLDLVRAREVRAVRQVVVAREVLRRELALAARPQEAPGGGLVPGPVVHVHDLVPARARQRVDLFVVVGELARQEEVGAESPLVTCAEVRAADGHRSVVGRRRADDRCDRADVVGGIAEDGGDQRIGRRDRPGQLAREEVARGVQIRDRAGGRSPA